MRTYKRQVIEISDIIGNAGRDNLYGLGDIDHKRPYYVFFWKMLNGRKSPIYKYFDTIEKAENFKNKIKKELQEGLYQKEDIIP